MSRRENWADRLNRRLLPYLGPPPLGPYDEPEPGPVAIRSCPLCGKPMGEHSVERPGGNASSRLRCPSGAGSSGLGAGEAEQAS